MEARDEEGAVCWLGAVARVETDVGGQRAREEVGVEGADDAPAKGAHVGDCEGADAVREDFYGACVVAVEEVEEPLLLGGVAGEEGWVLGWEVVGGVGAVEGCEEGGGVCEVVEGGEGDG